MRRVKRWEENWRVIAPPSATRLELPSSHTGRRALVAELHALPVGSPVVLAATAPRAGAGCKRVAEQSGIAVERNYLAFPSASAPAFLVEDERASTKTLARNVLTAPPQSALALPIQAALRLLRLPGGWRLLRLLAPGRLAVGRRT